MEDFEGLYFNLIIWKNFQEFKGLNFVSLNSILCLLKVNLLVYWEVVDGNMVQALLILSTGPLLNLPFH